MAKYLFIFLVVTIFVSIGSGYVQELILHEREDENGHVQAYRSNVPHFFNSPFAGGVKRVCVSGLFVVYEKVNFENAQQSFWSDAPTQTCYNVDNFNWRSFRHVAAEDTSKSALSLYPGVSWEGVEIFVDGLEQGGINAPINALTSTGPAQWTLFEGQNFDGNSLCWEGSRNTEWMYNYEYNITSLGLSTIGSVRQGC